MTTLSITDQLADDKSLLLDYFRSRASESLQEVRRLYAETQFKKRGGAVNKAMVASRQGVVQAVLQRARSESWSQDLTLKTILMVTYTNYVVMLEARNDVWPYEYMAFSRRIGELWEPFCKLCFDYPLTSLTYFVPPLFADVQRQLKNEITDYVNALSITEQQKEELLRYYDKVWGLVTSGEIKLELDLHFELNSQKYDIDFKSGFGSNEKGNTNRLLLVATIYKNLDDAHKCVLLVRSSDDLNNHYFQTLKNSSVWEAYCGDDAYNKVSEFTGFDLSLWVRNNITWMADLNDATEKHFKDNDLDHYLTW